MTSPNGTAAEMPQDPARPTTPAEKLRVLMDQHARRHGTRVTANYVATQIRGQGGKISHTTISTILAGGTPTVASAEQLEDFFGVARGFLLYDLPPLDPKAPDKETALRTYAAAHPDQAVQVEILLEMRRLGIERIGARGASSTREGYEAFLKVLQGMSKLDPSDTETVLRVVDGLGKAAERRPPE
ncbi:hypothetical protein [Longispora fulva]|uniref:Uncharacterized protein n=1 Tax=Longispora fulva TaxID=619741 RepID=A0A8J7KNR1_9ACTN|nr:hypothetical protein [Longispora fulva]MBG6140526.1 hypothetical protein [Longispora fulva]